MEVQAMATQLTITKRIQGLLTAGLVAMLVACGGGGSSSSEETLESSIPVTARGVITQLGSIWVTGCRYVAAPGGSYKNDDDDSASFDDYEVGQLVEAGKAMTAFPALPTKSNTKPKSRVLPMSTGKLTASR
jgi:hypothetical protein